MESGEEGGSFGGCRVVKWILLDHWHMAGCPAWRPQAPARAPGKLGIPVRLFQPQQNL